ncbi:hypothetical protein SO802_002379 [Lithocarpus litseifolius]|uniref:Major facilitator superfamily (MFS) profile domain-containing protein n=1 Tax=Lithocarpus litseifolius TaxID=425828 RepID=A0AAW2E156_9ROSI
MKILTKRIIFLEVLRKNMKMVWKPNKGLQISEIEHDMFLVEFGDGRDKKRIMEMCPWSFEKQLIFLQDFEGELIPKEIVLQWTPFWVQIYNLPLKSMTRETGMEVGAKIGMVLDIDVPKIGVQWGKFLRVQIRFDATKKLEASDHSTNQYCKLDSVKLTMFTSSLYLAALVASFCASWVTKKLGRKISMFIGGLVFLAGAIINAAAVNIAILIIGRILLGNGVGFANQSVPLYLSEMAPYKLRGSLNVVFQLCITIGILIANVVNYLTHKLGAEFKDLVTASEASKAVKNPWRNIRNRQYRPQLIMSMAIPFFQQFTGINVIMFYAPQLFKTIGFGDDASLLSALITGGLNCLATIVSTYGFGDSLHWMEIWSIWSSDILAQVVCWPCCGFHLCLCSCICVVMGTIEMVGPE